jgi:hypothetical protein
MERRINNMKLIIDVGTDRKTFLLSCAYADINYLLIEGFDTNHVDCQLDGIRDTLDEIRDVLKDEPTFEQYLEEYKEKENESRKEAADEMMDAAASIFGKEDSK